MTSPAGIPLPHVPSAEEQQYIDACGAAIDAGAVAAQEAATAGESETYLRFAQGVKLLTDALVELKNGGKPAGGAQTPFGGPGA